MNDDVLQAVRALLPAISERAPDCDESGQIPEETMRELIDSGVFRLLKPRRYGGREADPARFFQAVRDVSGACPSTGWVVGVLGVHPWQLGLFDDQAQHDVWNGEPDALICSSYAPVGRLTPVEGGYRLSGRWRFASGCGFASWAMVGAVVMGSEGRPVDFLSMLVPRQDFEIKHVWDVVGMRGTASDDIVVDNAFVPTYRIIRNYDQAQLYGPGQRVNQGPLYRMPFAAIFTTAVSSALVGATAGCYDNYLGAMRDRVRLSFGGGRFVEDEFMQVAIARAATEIDAAVLQMERNITELYEHVCRHDPIPMQLRLRTRRDQARATERALEAIDTLFQTAGGMSLGRGNPVERVWRDVHAGSVHVANETNRALALFGKGEFGFTVEDNLV